MDNKMRRGKKHHGAPSQPSKEALAILLERGGVRLDPVRLEQLWRYHSLLRSRNQDRDLTRLVGFESMVIKHYLDCMVVGDYMHLPSPLLDVGTGAGFPGIPLKIRYPGIQLILAEPRPRRVAFLREACSAIPLKGVEIFDHKVVSQSFQRPVKGVITRAVETIDKTLLRTSACVGKGGLIIFMKGPNVDAEINEAQRRCKLTHRLASDKHYSLPGTTYQRRLVIFERTVDPELPTE
jgi:16S rRNA (guanine(527)-N(7))-methyltransferase RsmG